MNLSTLIITPELFVEIDEFNGGWKAQGSLNPDYLTQLRHVATIESIGSSSRIDRHGKARANWYSKSFDYQHG